MPDLKKFLKENQVYKDFKLECRGKGRRLKDRSFNCFMKTWSEFTICPINDILLWRKTNDPFLWSRLDKKFSSYYNNDKSK